MCDPTSAMALIAAAATAFQVQSQRQQAKFEAGTARYNARTAENEAQQIRNVASEKENIQRRRTAELVSKQRAQIGASGIELGSGSAAQLQEDALTLGEVDALRIRDTGNQQFAAAMDESRFQTARADAFDSFAKSTTAASLLDRGSELFGVGVSAKWFTSDSAAAQTSGSPGRLLN